MTADNLREWADWMDNPAECKRPSGVNPATSPDLLEALKSLTEISQRINDIQHAGQKVWPERWAELYQATNEAKAAIAKATNQAG